MTPRQFFDKVVAMRAAQKAYFAAAKGTPEKGKYYRESINLETEIDAEIERVKELLPTLQNQ